MKMWTGSKEFAGIFSYSNEFTKYIEVENQMELKVHDEIFYLFHLLLFFFFQIFTLNRIICYKTIDLVSTYDTQLNYSISIRIYFKFKK